MARRIKFFTTGGTIDSEAYRNPQKPPADATNKRSYVAKILHRLFQQIRQIKPGLEFDPQKDLEEVSQSDSKSMQERHIAELAFRIREDNEHDVFVITHGTDTLAMNSRIMMQELNDYLKREGKVVIFTGAQMPLANELENRKKPRGGKRLESDGTRNLKFIIENFDNPDLFKPGVRVVMGGKQLDERGHMKVDIFSPIGLREAEIKIRSASGKVKKYWPFAYIKDFTNGDIKNGRVEWVDHTEAGDSKGPITTRETRYATRIGKSRDYEGVHSLTPRAR